MPEEIYNAQGSTNPRPVFLTILCVLTFIGSIAGIIQNTKGYLNAPAEVDNISSGKSRTQLKNIFSSASVAEEQPVMITNLNVENYKKYSIGCIISSVLCLVGTILMLRLKRTGFIRLRWAHFST